MYTKTWTDSIPYKGHYQAQSWGLNPPSGPFTDSIGDVTGNLVWTSTKTGQSVQGWRKIIREGGNANSPYSRTATRVSVLPGESATVGYTNPGVSKVTQGCSGYIRIPTLPSFPAFPDEVGNKALVRILGKIRNEYEHVNVLPALGELRSTVSQFGAPATALLSLSNRHLNKLALEYRGLKGSTAFRKAKWHRIIASSYLEYTFGLKPLIEDTRSIAEALARWKAEKDGDLPRPTSNLLTASGKARTVVENTDPLVTPFPGMGLLGYYRNSSVTTEFGVRYVVKLRHSMQAEFGSNDRLLQLLGLNNPLNFIPTLWEVLPWSWLYDYFLNVQEIIQAGVTTTSNVDWIVRTERIKLLAKENLIPWKSARVAGQFPVNWEVQPTHLGRSLIERTSLTRSLPSSLGLPVPVVSYPNTIHKLTNITAALFARRAQAHALWLF